MSKQTKKEKYEGIFFSGRNGVGFVRTPELEHVIEVPAHATGEAMHRDRVLVEAAKDSKSTGYLGKVLEVTRTAYRHHICELVEKGGQWYGIPADRHNRHVEILLTKHQAQAHQPQAGRLALVTITHWSHTAIGEIKEILKELPNAEEMNQRFAQIYGFEATFPENIQAEAEALAADADFDPNEPHRRDMRDVTTFTIDPDDAKDFDDALSMRMLPDGGVEIGVHIADVAHYVVQGTELDLEARDRGTSVYLVDQTIPMLPEVLSNNLCSLRPNEIKRAFSVVMTFSPQFEITDTWYGRTWIESDKRFTYGEAQEVMDAGSGLFADELILCNTIAKQYREQRFAEGALALEKDELRFVLDDAGEPLEVRTKTRQDVHKMIEEMMLLANRLVAQHIATQRPRDISLYRVHDRPDRDRVTELRDFLRAIGYTDANIHGGVVPSPYLRTLVEEIEDPHLRDAVSLSIARSMSKAIYTTENRGHYGLGFSFYTHFTSPIRRYPDILVHRHLWELLSGAPQDVETTTSLETWAAENSAREKDAADAERQSIAYTQARYMRNKVGQVFTGMITGLNGSGIFLSEDSTKTEGLARYRDIAGTGFWNFNEKKKSARNTTTGEEAHIGDRVRMKLTKVDVEQRMIDWELLAIGKDAEIEPGGDTT